MRVSTTTVPLNWGSASLNGSYSVEHEVSFPVSFFVSSLVVITANNIIVFAAVSHFMV